jgi:DNA (cytosine-5)-methyltransferase 1
VPSHGNYLSDLSAIGLTPEALDSELSAITLSSIKHQTEGMDVKQQLGSVLSVFSGAGGLDLGLEKAGLKTVGCLEIEPVARETIRHNRPEWQLLEPSDVNVAANELQPRDLGMRKRELDLIAGGPPCQPFSKAAQWQPAARQGMRDPRAQAVYGLLDLVASFLPKAILLENVEGFLKGPASARGVIENGLKEINALHGTSYQLEAAVLDAADFGVPQHRRRAIAVARRDGKSFTFPEPTRLGKPPSAWDAIADLPRVDWSPTPGLWTELLPSVPEGSNYLYLTARGGGPELFGWRSRYWSFLLKLARDRPSWTLPASPGPYTGPFHWDNRPLTVHERLRLQGFPDDWELCGSHVRQVKMSGNATPPPLGEVIGRELVRQLKLGEADERERVLCRPPLLAIVRRSDCPTASAPVAVPGQFLHLAGPKAAHPGTGRGPAPRSAPPSIVTENA